MKNFVLPLGALVVLSAFDWQPFAAVDSTEAVMTFSNRVEFRLSHEPSVAEARDKIEAQLSHLFGPMSAAAVKAVPRGNHRLSEIRVEKKPETKSTYVASYSYQGTIVLQGLSGSSYSVPLPVNPDRIYRAGMKTRPSGTTYNPCTDAHYQDEVDFWYFWNPENPGCELREGIDFTRVSAKVRRSSNTVRTYPEYSRLADENGVIRISVLFGMDDPDKGKNPDRSADINARNFVGFRRTLLKMGYRGRELSEDEIRGVAPAGTVVAHVEELVRELPRAKIVIRLFFGPSGIDEESAGFHHFLRDAMENASVFIFDGHSGLGSNLDLPKIEGMNGFSIRPPKSRYQIYFFNSCSSYTYYNSAFFSRKRSDADPLGTKNLDILANGLATYFSSVGESNMELVKAVDDWASGRPGKSYQELAAAIDTDNLFGVNGDEDNPTEQPR